MKGAPQKRARGSAAEERIDGEIADTRLHEIAKDPTRLVPFEEVLRRLRMHIETTPHVLSASTRMALEKNAEEFARDMNADVAFRTELREAARASARELAASLRASRTRRMKS